MAHSASTTALLVRVVVAFALTFVLGFERELRGSPAGDRTFSLIGIASAVLGNLASAGSPNAIAGAVTGIGFTGGGIVFRRAVRTTSAPARWSAGSPRRRRSSRPPRLARRPERDCWPWPRWRAPRSSSRWKGRTFPCSGHLQSP